jgi:hypothetical protein
MDPINRTNFVLVCAGQFIMKRKTINDSVVLFGKIIPILNIYLKGNIMITQTRTRIISAFPGTGKHTIIKTTLDSDSSLFSWITIDGEKVRNP